MPIFEPDSGRPRLVQPMQPLAGTFLGEVRTLLSEHLPAVVGEPLFAIRARSAMPEHVDEPAKLHVSFLTGKADLSGVKTIDAAAFEPDRFVVDGSHLYLWFPNGAGRSKLATLPWRKKIGVAGTARNWRTVQTVLDLLDA